MSEWSPYCSNVSSQVSGSGKQNPQCEGNQNFICFTSIPESRPRYTITKKKEVFTLKAGSVHGFTKGDLLAIYKTATSEQSLGILRCINVATTTARLELLDDSSSLADGDWFALQVSSSQEEKLKVYSSAEDLNYRLLDFEKELDKDHYSSVTVVQKEEEAHMILDKSGDKISFGIRHMLNKIKPIELCPRFTQTVGMVSDEQLKQILNSASHYHWHLRRTPPFSKLQEKVKIKFLRLRHPRSGEQGMQPVDDNLIHNGIISVRFDSDVGYGFEITTQLDGDIYPWVFYFENHTLSICEYDTH